MSEKQTRPIVDSNNNIWYVSEGGGVGTTNETISVHFVDKETIKFVFPGQAWFQMSVKPQVVIESERYKKKYEITKRFLELWDAAFDYHVSNVVYERLVKPYKARTLAGVKYAHHKNSIVACVHGEMTVEFKKLIEKVG